MCGIVGIVSKEPFTSREVLERLKKLEYRGYDSWGYWNGKHLIKKVGKIKVLDDKEETLMAISHTRWATHGNVTEENAHPHRAGKVTLVHNGIIENWQELKKSLTGCTFHSGTDSEVLAHLLNQQLQQGRTPEEALRTLVKRVKGTFALLVMIDGDPRLYAAKRDSPLALGLCGERAILASDLYAFSDATKRAIFFENNEYAVITPTTYHFYNQEGVSVQKEPEEFTWDAATTSQQGYDHYMLKEIHEEPSVNKTLLFSIQDEQAAAFQRLIKLIKGKKKTVFTAAGTAYHASLIGASLLHQVGIEAQAVIASEFENFITVNEETLVVAVSQSGETMDVIEALKYSKERGATIASMVNVPHSTIERMASSRLRIHAGQEVAVASTKAFTNQVTLLLSLAQALGYPGTTTALPKKIAGILAFEPEIKKLAAHLAPKNDLYIIGRRLGYPVAREIALKIKEVSYLHAEGMMGGELKHGTIALIEEGTPVISLIYRDDPKMRGSTQEVKARGAHTLVFGTTPSSDLFIPAENEAEFALLASTLGQLLAYYVAKERGLPIDQPRNLAKSVTVL